MRDASRRTAAPDVALPRSQNPEEPVADDPTGGADTNESDEDRPDVPFGEAEGDRDALREHFQQIALHRLLKLEHVELSEERVVTEMPVAPEAFNPAGNLHGGAIATLIDVAAGTAAALGTPNFEPGVNTLVTADMHIRYLGRAKGDKIRATAKVIRAGRQLTVVECQVTDPDSGKLVATADFSSMVVDFREPLDPTHGDATQADM